MESPKYMDTSLDLSKLEIRSLETDLPNDEEIKQYLQEKYGKRKEIDHKTDNDMDNDALSDCESDIEGMENLWDALIPSNEPYGNTIEHLQKILESLPRRLGTRSRKEVERFDQRIHDKKQMEKIENILNTHLVDADIDEEVLMQNLQRIRAQINNVIRKKAIDKQKWYNGENDTI